MKKKVSRKGSNNVLKITSQGGCLVWAVIGDYEGKGEQRVILHEVDLNYKQELYSYGHKRVWNFPVKAAK